MAARTWRLFPYRPLLRAGLPRRGRLLLGWGRLGALGASVDAVLCIQLLWVTVRACSVSKFRTQFPAPARLRLLWWCLHLPAFASPPAPPLLVVRCPLLLRSRREPRLLLRLRLQQEPQLLLQLRSQQEPRLPLQLRLQREPRLLLQLRSQREPPLLLQLRLQQEPRLPLRLHSRLVPRLLLRRLWVRLLLRLRVPLVPWLPLRLRVPWERRSPHPLRLSLEPPPSLRLRLSRLSRLPLPLPLPSASPPVVALLWCRAAADPLAGTMASGCRLSAPLAGRSRSTHLARSRGGAVSGLRSSRQSLRPRRSCLATVRRGQLSTAPVPDRS